MISMLSRRVVSVSYACLFLNHPQVTACPRALCHNNIEPWERKHYFFTGATGEFSKSRVASTACNMVFI
eukprot:1268730-Amphidinium_carterae.1